MWQHLNQTEQRGNGMRGRREGEGTVLVAPVQRLRVLIQGSGGSVATCETGLLLWILPEVPPTPPQIPHAVDD